MSEKIDWTPIKEFKEILFTQHGGIAKISINRPQVHNAFTPLTVDEMNADVVFLLEMLR
jgi:naphthoate synthase